MCMELLFRAAQRAFSLDVMALHIAAAQK